MEVSYIILMHISLVLGTAREGRKSEQVARIVFESLKKRTETPSVFVDIRDHLDTFATTRFGLEDERPHAWKDTARDSDGFIFVIPEYNHGYPGEWKLLMDSLYKKEYMGKVAALVGVSSGSFGGVRALEQATLSLSGRGMYVMKDTLNFIRVGDQFDEEGNLVDDEQKEQIENFIDKVIEVTNKYRIKQ